MVHHHRSRKKELLKAVERNGLTSSLNSNHSSSAQLDHSGNRGAFQYDNHIHYSNQTQQQQEFIESEHETQNEIYDDINFDEDPYDEIDNDEPPVSSENYISSNNGKPSSHNRVQFADDRVQEISNSRVARVRGAKIQKRKPNSTKCVLLRRNREIGFGFSIRGGVEHGTGIFISNINKYSDAHAQGLQVGDQIIRANNALFEGILHDEAVQVRYISI